MPTLLMGDFIANGYQGKEDPDITYLDSYLPTQIFGILKKFQEEYPNGQFTTNNLAALQWAEEKHWNILFLMPDGTKKRPEETEHPNWLAHFSLVTLVLKGRLP